VPRKIKLDNMQLRELKPDESCSEAEIEVEIDGARFCVLKSSVEEE
jgi:hypothetical protein